MTLPRSHAMVTAKSISNERKRRHLVNLVLIVYWLLIFEGILRKWIWPEYSQYLFFIRDPFVLIIYFLALKNGMWPRAQPMLIIAYALSLLAIVWILIQMLTGNVISGTKILLAGYGWRNYFLYIPLAFLIAEQFYLDDLYRLIRQTLVIVIPISILVTIQFWSPANSIINSAISDGDTTAFMAFRGALGHVRPYGTFTSFRGQMQFVVSCITMILIMWILPSKQRRMPLLLLVISASATITCLAVSISRGMFIHSGLVTISALVAGIALRGQASARAWFLPIFLITIVLIIFPTIFPEAFHAFLTRWTEGETLETKNFGALGVFGRALYEFYDFFRLIDSTPLFGYGMGMGGNASTVLGLTIGGESPLAVAESDWSRHFIDMGPVFAGLFILFRIFLVFLLGIKSLRATRRSGNPMPVLLFGFVGITLLYGQVTGHGSVTGYAWLFAGFLLAAIKPIKSSPIGPNKNKNKRLNKYI